MGGVTMIDEPRVWIGCLQCLNNGDLIGDWYPATEASNLTTSRLHGRPIPQHNHEELWCLDTDNIPVDREMDPLEASQWGELFDEVGPDQWPALCAWVRSGSYLSQGSSDLPVVSDFEECFCGTWPSFTDYADELISEGGMLESVPDELRAYFDTDRYARDLAGDYSVEPTGTGEVFIFRSF